MLLVPCPWCGRRSRTEFAYGGDASVSRPAGFEAGSDDTWLDYVFLRENPAGPHSEYWYHQHGCRRWFKVARDTVTNEFLASSDSDSYSPDQGR